MAINLKVLTIENKEYYWDFDKAKRILDSYKQKEGKYKNIVFEELHDILNISSDAVKKWFTKGNGPGEPEYVIKMAEYFGGNYQDLVKEKMTMDKILNMMISSDITGERKTFAKTVNFIGEINRFALDTRYGFMTFKEYVKKVKENNNFDFKGIIYVDDPGINHGQIVGDMCVDSQHEDIISTCDGYFDDLGSNYYFRVNDEWSKPYIELSGEGVDIIIEDGTWYSP